MRNTMNVSLSVVVLALFVTVVAAPVAGDVFWEGNTNPEDIGYSLEGLNIFTFDSPPGKTTVDSTRGVGTYVLGVGLTEAAGWEVRMNVTRADHTGGGNHESAFIDIEDDTGGISLKFFGNAINISDDITTYGDLWNGTPCCSGANGTPNTAPPNEVVVSRAAGSEHVFVQVDGVDPPFGPYTATDYIGVADGTQRVRFGGSNTGGGTISEWDYIRVISSAEPPPPTLPDFKWRADVSGDWNDDGNWEQVGNGDEVPNGINHAAVFGDVIQSPQTVLTNIPVSVSSIEFNNSVSYAIAGHGSVTMVSGTNAVGDVPPEVEVKFGSHEFQAPFHLGDDTNLEVLSGATLTFNNALNLNDSTLTKVGEGTLNINNVLAASGGELNCSEGVCSGHGTIGGNLNNESGTVSPGNSSAVTTTPEPGGLVLLVLASVGLFLLPRGRANSDNS